MKQILEKEVLADESVPVDAIPEGWCSVKLGEHVYIAGRIGWRGLKRSEYSSDGPIFLAVNNILSSGEIDFTHANHISIFRFDESPEIKLQSGDILLTKDGTIGKVGQIRGLSRDATVNSSILVLRPNGLLSTRYLFHYLRGPQFQRVAQQRIAGSAVPHLFQKDIKQLSALVPPAIEQQRIVGEIHTLLARVDSTRIHLSHVPTILRRFRQAVLAAACSGRLTEDWRELKRVSEDARHQLEQMQVERREHHAANGKRKYREPDAVLKEDLPEIPKTWCWTNFDHCSWEITVGHVGPMRERYVAAGIRFLRCQNVRPLHFDPLGLVHIPPDFHAQLSKSQLCGGEILVVRSGANTGDCCVFPADLAPANCSDLVITRPLSGLSAKYGALYVSSPTGQARLTFNETGIAQPHFNVGAMRVKAFPLPPLAEQKEIVRRVDALFGLADAIQERVKPAILSIDKLTQSILAKAFRGELVPTEAELARREGREYEPASVLLERIRAERISQTKPSKIKRSARKASVHA